MPNSFLARWGALEAMPSSADAHDRPTTLGSSFAASSVPLRRFNINEYADVDQHEGLELVR
jgi:hypothetical protein